ncbi:MAG: hypothetical protein WCC60_19385 [Ilumatobacteraceae bacterium]
MRTNDAEVAELLRARLQPWVVQADAAPNISLTVGARKLGKREAHRVYRSGVQSFRSFDLDEAIGAAVAHVYTMLRPPPGALEVFGRAVVRNGMAVVLGDAFGERIDSHARRLVDEGYELVPYSPVLVDPARGELLLREDLAPAGGSYRRVPISAVVALAAPPVPTDSPVVSFSHLSALVASRTGPTCAAHIEGLLVLQQRVPIVRHDDLDSRSVVSLIRSL